MLANDRLRRADIVYRGNLRRHFVLRLAKCSVKKRRINPVGAAHFAEPRLAEASVAAAANRQLGSSRISVPAQ